MLIRSSQITAGGAGTVTVHGTGGTTSGGPNRGVEMQGGTITSSGGNVQVTGIGGAAAGSATNGTNIGVFILNAAQISAGGTGTVTVHGTGSMAGGVNNHGVFVTGDVSRITSQRRQHSGHRHPGAAGVRHRLLRHQSRQPTAAWCPPAPPIST